MALTKDDKNWILDAFSKMLGLTEARLEKRIDEKIDDKFNNHPVFARILEKLDAVLGNQRRDKDELDIVSAIVYDDIEPRVTALEDK